MYKNQLVYLRKRNGIKLKELSKLLNIDKSTYGHYEKEDNIIPLKHLIKICDYFNVSLDFIFGFNKTNYNVKKEYNKDLFCKRFLELRNEKNISQEVLARILKNKRTNISGYELGKHLISTSFLYEICTKYKISADYLLGKIDNPKYLK